MDCLIVEALDPEVLAWLEGRHGVRYAPELADDPVALRRALVRARALIAPPSVALHGDVLVGAPGLVAVGRLSAGAENLDLEACARLGVEVVRPLHAAAAAEAEFVIGALLQMLRRVPVVNAEGLWVGRELGGATVGLVGLAPAARVLSPLLQAFGARVVGYDPAVHETDPLWARWEIAHQPLAELFETCDAVAVLLGYFSRYRGLLGQRVLELSRPNQVLVCLAPSSVFDEVPLAHALLSGRMAAAWFDSMEPSMVGPGRPLSRVATLQVTPRVASTTLESRSRGAWAVAQRIDELLRAAPPLRSAADGARAEPRRDAARPRPRGPDFNETPPDALADLADRPAPA